MTIDEDKLYPRRTQDDDGERFHRHHKPRPDPWEGTGEQITQGIIDELIWEIIREHYLLPW